MHDDALGAITARPGQSRKQRLGSFNELFRAGSVPEPALNGAYAGELLALDVAPGISTLLEWLTSMLKPWQGKHLSHADGQGDNIFDNRYRLRFRLVYPFYRHATPFGEHTFRAFTFATSIRQGKDDPDRDVLNIDYDNPDNPALTIRRIIDELVQVDESVYLGKIYFKWWGKWQMIGYFSLRPPGSPGT